MLNIFLIYFRKSSFHFNLSNEITNFASFRLKPSTVTMRTTYTFEQNVCSSMFLGYLAHFFAYTLIQTEKNIFHK